MRRHLTVLLAAIVLLAGCGSGTAENEQSPAATGDATWPRTVEVPAGAELAATDVVLDQEPQRIAALTYETAELVAGLGAADRLVLVPQAATSPVISNHPEVMADVEQHIPTESSVDAEAVIATQPDLVLLSDRHGLEEGVGEVLRGSGIPVLVLPNHWASVEDMTLNIELVGQALGLDDAAAALSEEIDTGLGEATDSAGPRVLVLSNQAGRPFVTAGEAFPLEVLRLAGGQDAGEDLGLVRSGPITVEQMLAVEPEAILLVDMNGSGRQVFDSLLENSAVAALPAVADDRVLLVEGREIQALGLASTVTGRERIAEWLAD